MGFDQIKQAWNSAVHLYKTGHPVDALKSFIGGLWKGKKVVQKHQGNVILEPLDKHGNPLEKRTVKSNLKYGRNQLQADEKKLYERAAKKNQATPFLSQTPEVKKTTETRTQKEEVPAKVRVDKRVKVSGVTKGRAKKSAVHTSKEKRDEKISKAVYLLKNEGIKGFQKELAGSFNTENELLGLRDRLIKEELLTPEVETIWKDVAILKAEDNTQNPLAQQGGRGLYTKATDAIHILNTEGKQAFEEELVMSFHTADELFDFRDFLIDKNMLSVEAEEVCKQVISYKIADNFTESMTSGYITGALGKSEYKSLLESANEETAIKEELEIFLKERFIGVERGHSYTFYQYEQINAEYKALCELFDMRTTLSQVVRNLEDEFENADDTWEALHKDVLPIASSTQKKTLVDANREWDINPNSKKR